MKNSLDYEVTVENEKIKRAYFRWLKEADGKCDSTVDAVTKAIHVYEDFTKHDSFRHFNQDQAVSFKKWLRKREYRGQPIQLTTFVMYLRHIKSFFSWLSQKPGYRKNVTFENVGYLSATDNEIRAAAQSDEPNHPSLAYVLKLVGSIVGDNEVDRRDQAMISFLFLTGIRETALASLRLGCFDENRLCVRQAHSLGVITKRSKFIFTVIFPFDEGLQNHILAWAKYLGEKGFGSKGPLFPRSKMFQKRAGDLCYETTHTVEPEFWKTGDRVQGILKERSQAANMEYFSPHAFRHLGARLGLQACRTGEHVKAVANSFGHEHVETLLRVYGNPTQERMLEIRSEMEFSSNEKDSLGGKVSFI